MGRAGIPQYIVLTADGATNRLRNGSLCSQAACEAELVTVTQSVLSRSPNLNIIYVGIMSTIDIGLSVHVHLIVATSEN